jgi:hypothetical protein
VARINMPAVGPYLPTPGELILARRGALDVYRRALVMAVSRLRRDGKQLVTMLWLEPDPTQDPPIVVGGTARVLYDGVNLFFKKFEDGTTCPMCGHWTARSLDPESFGFGESGPDGD